MRAGSLRLTDWRDGLTNALDVTARSPHPLLVIDELSYLLQHSPEIPGLLQQLYDECRRGARPGAGPGPRLILCGSAMSVMHELLSGTKPLRGRAVADLRLGPFDHWDSRAFWQITDPLTALKVHAVLAGAPGLPAGGRSPASGRRLVVLRRWAAHPCCRVSHEIPMKSR